MLWLRVTCVAVCALLGCAAPSQTADAAATSDTVAAASTDTAHSLDSSTNHSDTSASSSANGDGQGAGASLDPDVETTGAGDGGTQTSDAEISTFPCPTAAGVHKVGAAKPWLVQGAAGVVVRVHRSGQKAVFSGFSEIAASAISPFDPASYGKPAATVHTTALLDPLALQACAGLSSPPWPSVSLIEPRFRPVIRFYPPSTPNDKPSATVQAPQSAILFGGFMHLGGKFLPTPIVTILDLKTSSLGIAKGSHPHLLYPRVDHTVTPLGPGAKRYLVVGGRGPKPEASATWELWDHASGRVASGSLNRPRWNHRAVLLPGGSVVGHILLLGGEDSTGPIADYEVLRYDGLGNIASKGSTKITCTISGKYVGGAGSTSECDAVAGTPGVKTYTFVPIVADLPEKLGRSRPGVAFVKHAGLHHLWVVGGFTGPNNTAPTHRIDILDTASALWLPTKEAFPSAPSLLARGAPLVVPGPGVDSPVLIAGGVDGNGATVGSPAVFRYQSSGAAFSLHQTLLPDPQGLLSRVGAASIRTMNAESKGSNESPNGGSVAVVGGVRGKPASWSAAAEVALWRP